MKKILVVLLMLSLVTSIFADRSDVDNRTHGWNSIIIELNLTINN